MFIRAVSLRLVVLSSRAIALGICQIELMIQASATGRSLAPRRSDNAVASIARSHHFVEQRHLKEPRTEESQFGSGVSRGVGVTAD